MPGLTTAFSVLTRAAWKGVVDFSRAVGAEIVSCGSRKPHRPPAAAIDGPRSSSTPSAT